MSCAIWALSLSNGGDILMRLAHAQQAKENSPKATGKNHMTHALRPSTTGKALHSSKDTPARKSPRTPLAVPMAAISSRVFQMQRAHGRAGGTLALAENLEH